ncbi:MAG: hypothetical protein KDD63_00220 [Bacteroidetes bacterium]|nr:hypothetical protein [Bacteroidota bacterium]
MNVSEQKQNTSAWRFQVWASFIISLGLTMGGVFYLPVDFWIKGYLAMGLMFLIGSCFSLAKTIRDDHEASSLINRVKQAKTEKMLSEFEK